MTSLEEFKPGTADAVSEATGTVSQAQHTPQSHKLHESSSSAPHPGHAIPRRMTGCGFLCEALTAISSAVHRNKWIRPGHGEVLTPSGSREFAYNYGLKDFEAGDAVYAFKDRTGRLIIS